MLARLLNSHPNIIQTHESSAFLHFDYLIKNAMYGGDGNILYGKEYQELWGRELGCAAPAVIEGFYEKICAVEKRTAVSYWGDKHPHHNACLPFLTAFYPKARYVYVVRDPRDVLCSIQEMRQSSLEESLAVWNAISGDYERFASEKTDGLLFQIRYEDVVADYVGGIGSVVDWLGVPVDEDYREMIKSNQSVDFHALECSQQFDFAVRSVSRWQGILTEGDHEKILMTCGSYMEKYGYR